MSSDSSPKCPQCGATLKENAPAGLCPNCLMALNLKTETVFTDDAPAAQPPLPPEQIAPHFPQLEILECLGRGGMGVVYKARQKSLNRFVALKLLAPERVGDAKFAERFTREAQALAALNHPNIVTIYDFGQAGGFYYLLMEFVDGVNLRQLLRARKFTPEEALAIVPPLCDALQFAHDRGIVHRDIKPENLLLDKNGRIKVADFGIARMLGGEGDPVSSVKEERVATGGSDLTQNTAVGTPGYSAPEQKTDPQRVDSRADIYSLGVVFYEMLTGELPGKGIEAPSRKVHIDVRLDEIVLRALDQKPELRFQQASEMKTCVETIAATPISGRRRGDESQTGSGKSGASRPAAIVKSERARLTVQESAGMEASQPVMGEVTLYTDRLIISSGYSQRSIPLADIHALGEAVTPFLFNPGALRFAAVDFDEAGQRRRLVFLAGTSLFRWPGDTRRHSAEWLTAIQRTIKSADGRDLPIANVPTVVRVRIQWSLIWLLMPLLAAGPLIVVVFSGNGFISVLLKLTLASLLLTAVILFVAFVMRSILLRGTPKGPPGSTGVPDNPPEPPLGKSSGFAAPLSPPGSSNRLPRSLIWASVLLILLGTVSLCDMAWHARFGDLKLDLTLLCLPVGMGLLRGRWAWRRFTLAGVWFGYAALLIFFSIMLAGVLMGPGKLSFELFGWQSNAARMLWIGAACFVLQTALLVWLQLELLRPGVKAFFEQQRRKGTGWPEWLMIIALAWFAVVWAPMRVRQERSFDGPAAEIWSPAQAAGQKPDLAKIHDEARTLVNQTNYEEALQRQIWYFNHALDYDPSLVGVRRSFTLSDWAELGRSYPKAREAMAEIRDRDLQIFNEGMRFPLSVKELSSGLPGFSEIEQRSRFDLFQDIYSLNSYLGNDDTNRALVKALVAHDPQLARHMGYRTSDDAFDALLKKSTNGAAHGDLGDGQAAFSAICEQWVWLKKEEVRVAKIYAHGQKNIDDYRAKSGQKPFPMHQPIIAPPRAADSIFVDKTRHLIEILVANGHKADAENIRDQALALVNDLWLKSAVSDAVVKLQKTSAPASTP